MPGYDRTGPRGQGSLTGRGLGPCGRGLAFRRGLGRGFGRSFAGRRLVTDSYLDYPTEPVALNKEEEKKILETEKAEIEAELKALEKRLKELK